MKRLKNFHPMLIAVAMLWSVPTIQAYDESRSSSPLQRDVRGIQRDFDEFCDRMNRYLRHRHIDRDAQYARRTLSDFGDALEILAVDIEKIRPGSPYLKRSIENVQTRYFRAKHYLKYLNLPAYLIRDFGHLTGGISRLDEYHGNPDHPGHGNPGHGDPGHGGPNHPAPIYANLEPYAEKLEEAANDMLRHARIEAPRGRRPGNRPHPGVHAFQVLEELTDEFEERADNQFYWTPGLIRLHRQIEAQYRAAGRFVRGFGRSTHKDYEDFGRAMNVFLYRHPYSRQYDRHDRDGRDDRNRDPGRDHPRGGDRPVTIGGDSWSIQIGGVF
jgi:hypothetical protein